MVLVASLRLSVLLVFSVKIFLQPALLLHTLFETEN